MMELRGRTALITGASRGIGLAVAERLSAGGARVLLVARGEKALTRAAERVDGRAEVLDVTDAEAVEAFRSVLDRWSDDGVPDILVNAAGVFALAPLAETAVAEFDRQLDVNLRGAFLMIRLVLTGMLERGAGRIVTIGSVAGRRAFPENGAYAASKFGVRGLHAVLDEELRGTGVVATLLDPGATDTSIWDDIAAGSNPGLPTRDQMLAPEAVAAVVHFVATRPAEVAIRSIHVERA